MRSLNTLTRLFAAIGVLAVPALVDASCLTPAEATDPADTGYATAVQADQGQGSIDCSVFTGPGGPMHQIQLLQDKPVGTVSPLDPIHWTVNSTDPDENVDVLFIGNSDGSRCNQYYKGNARAGFAAAGSKNNKAATVLGCSDGFSEQLPPAPPVPPISSSEDCSVDPDSAALQAAINDNGKYDVVIGIGRGAKGDNTAICSDNTGLGAQKRCVATCVTPDINSPIAYDPDAPECDTDGPFFPLKCRACELSIVVDSDPYTDENPPYCWEQLQKVDLTAGTFTKSPGPKSNQIWKVDEYAGSNCYLISGTTDTGYRYSYWVPTGCPK
jgi:hypothetical protein